MLEMGAGAFLNIPTQQETRMVRNRETSENERKPVEVQLTPTAACPQQL